MAPSLPRKYSLAEYHTKESRVLFSTGLGATLAWFAVVHDTSLTYELDQLAHAVRLEHVNDGSSPWSAVLIYLHSRSFECGTSTVVDLSYVGIWPKDGVRGL